MAAGSQGQGQGQGEGRGRDAGVDPRFDPQFQRGYDPAVHRAPRRSSAVRPVETRAAAPDPAGSTPPELRPDVEPQPAVSTAPTGSAGSVPEEYEAPRYNPFRLILLVTSITAIIGAGLLLWRRISTDPYGGYGGYGGDTGRIFVDQLMDALLTPLLTGGLLGVCLWIALGALRRRDDG